MEISNKRCFVFCTLVLIHAFLCPPVASFIFGSLESSTIEPSQCTLSSELDVICFCPQKGHRGTADCSSTGITSLPDSLSIPPWTVRLDLSRNNITEIVQGQFSLTKAPSLIEIDLSRNAIETIHVSAFLDLKQLQSLDLSHNQLRVLPEGAFQTLDSLLKLDLSNNHLSTLPNGIFKPIEGLKQLYLSFNPIGLSFETKQDSDEDSSKFLIPLRELDTLFLRNCSIKTVPEVLLRNSTNLRVLSLADNTGLEEVPTASFPQVGVTLESLDLSGCGMKTFPSHGFHALFVLRELTLERLQYLQGVEKYAFRDLTNLRSLSLSRCPRLTMIDVDAFRGDTEDASALNNLRELRVASCSLHHMDSNTVIWKKLDVLDLQGNPWHCDCHMVWLSKLNVSNEFRTDLTCTSPSKLAGVNLMDAPLPSLECTKHTFTENTVRIFLMAILDIVVLAVVVAGSAILCQLLKKLRCCRKCRRTKSVNRAKYKKITANKDKVDLEWDHGDIGDV